MVTLSVSDHSADIRLQCSIRRRRRSGSIHLNQSLWLTILTHLIHVLFIAYVHAPSVMQIIPYINFQTFNLILHVMCISTMHWRHQNMVTDHQPHNMPIQSYHPHSHHGCKSNIIINKPEDEE